MLAKEGESCCSARNTSLLNLELYFAVGTTPRLAPKQGIAGSVIKAALGELLPIMGWWVLVGTLHPEARAVLGLNSLLAFTMGRGQSDTRYVMVRMWKPLLLLPVEEAKDKGR